MNGFARRRALLDVLVAPARRTPSARIYCSRIPGVNCLTVKLVAPARLHQMSPRDGKMAASEGLVYFDRSVAALVALASERAARKAVRDCRGQ